MANGFPARIVATNEGVRFKEKREIGFLILFFALLLGILGCIDFTMSLSKSLMWHVLIGWCKPKGLHPILIEFNLFQFSMFN